MGNILVVGIENFNFRRYAVEIIFNSDPNFLVPKLGFTAIKLSVTLR
jgi:hypothetical protein